MLLSPFPTSLFTTLHYISPTSSLSSPSSSPSPFQLDVDLRRPHSPPIPVRSASSGEPAHRGVALVASWDPATIGRIESLSFDSVDGWTVTVLPQEITHGRITDAPPSNLIQRTTPNPPSLAWHCMVRPTNDSVPRQRFASSCPGLPLRESTPSSWSSTGVYLCACGLWCT